jgi:hypothetical protein
MNKYSIDYGGGIAEFYCEATEPREVEREFHACANHCFGIRKSIMRYSVRATYKGVELPLPYRGHGATHFLSHHGDEILFDARFHQDESGLEYWKLHVEGGGWCSCKERGKPQLDCEVHHFWVPGHDELCAECKARDAARKAEVAT